MHCGSTVPYEQSWNSSQSINGRVPKPGPQIVQIFKERVAEWLRRLTRKPKVRTAVGSNLALDSWSLSVTLARVDQSHVKEIW